MARKKYVLKIIEDKIKLSERALEINVDLNHLKLVTIISELKETLYSNPNLTVLSAPQLGKPFRVFCMKFAGGDIRTFH